MKRIYYPDHDKRYAHIPKEDRWLYPDEIHLSEYRAPIYRRKPFAELRKADVEYFGGAVSILLFANDIPYLKGCYNEYF